jgi:CubicO group peptidase (beta-lactamase class C family)
MLAPAAALALQAPQGAQVTTPDFSAARQTIRDRMAKDSLPGLTIAVTRGDSILWEEGFGWANRERRVPATPHTPFYLASLSKTITATALMILREQGRLDLDRPANEYLGGTRLWNPRWDASGATVRRIMTHTSGLTTFDLGCPTVQPHCRIPSREEIISRYGVLVWQPGERFDYSNLGYYVLGEVVAGASGRDFGAFLRDDVFRPLGMTRSSLGVDPALESQTAVQYHWVDGPVSHVRVITSGGSTIHGSAHDLALFGQLHARARRSQTRAILSTAAIDTMQYSSVPALRGQHYGLGWWIEEDRFGYRSLLAQGGTPAASAWMRVVPSEQVVVVVLANKGVGFPGEVIDSVLSAMLPRYATQIAARQTQQSGGASNPAAAPASAPALDSMFVGRWTGSVRSDSGDVPLAFTIFASGEARATVGSRPGEVSGRAQMGPSLLRINLPGDLTTPDSSGGRRFMFYLKPRDRALYGNLGATPAGLFGRVSYWVELRKQR